MEILKSFNDGTLYERGQGNFDEWCIYIVEPNGEKHAPRDMEYLTKLLDLQKQYGNIIYKNFVSIYNMTNNNVDTNVLDMIHNIAVPYNMDGLIVEKLYTILYLTMLAEENKKNTKLGKRIKRLAVHQVLMDKLPPKDAANYSKGKKWEIIDAECLEKGF